MSDKHIGFLYRVEFRNPYREPPAGKPRVLAEMFSTENTVPQEIRDFSDEVHGSGYGISISPVTAPPKMMDPEKLAVVRQKRVRRRTEGKFPMFAEEFIEREIERKPDYYLRGVTDEQIAAERSEAMAAWQERYDRCKRGELDRMVVHARLEVEG